MKDCSFIDAKSGMISRQCVKDCIKHVANMFYADYYLNKYGLKNSMTCNEYDQARIQGIENYTRELYKQIDILFTKAKEKEVMKESNEK